MVACKLGCILILNVAFDWLKMDCSCSHLLLLLLVTRPLSKDGLERNDICDFEKPRKRAYQKEKIESNEQSKEGGQPK